MTIIWTVAISFFVGIVSYILVSIESLSKNIFALIMLCLILVFLEIIFISIHFWVDRKKQEISKIIRNL